MRNSKIEEEVYDFDDAPEHVSITKRDATTAIEEQGALGSGPADLYCHTHRCDKTDKSKQVESDTVLWIKNRSPHTLPMREEQRLEQKGEKKADIDIHSVHDGFTAILLIGPSPENAELEVSGWYCSTDCVNSVTWPTPEHHAVVVELHVPHPPDVRRYGYPPQVKEIKGVLGSEEHSYQDTLKRN